MGRTTVAVLAAGGLIMSGTAASTVTSGVTAQPNQLSAHGSYEHGRVSVDGSELRYVRAGSGPPLVLLHGWPQTMFQWHKVMPTLAENNTVIAFDLPGLGGSTIPADGYDKATTAQRIREAVTKLGHEQVTLLGHDLGSMVAYEYAYQFPDEVSRIAVLDAPLPGFGLEDAYGMSFHFRFNMAPAPIPEKIMDDEDVETYLGMIFDNTVAPQEIPQEWYFRAYADSDKRTAGYEYYRTFPQDAQRNQANAAERKIAMPVLALGAEAAFGPGVAASFRGVAEDVREVVAPASGHFIAEENPEFLTDCMALFLGSGDRTDVPPELAGCRA